MTDSPGEANTAARLDDLERRATSAYLRGADDETEALWIGAHNECLRNGDVPRAARCIFWLVLDLFTRSEWARGNGWLARGLHLLEPVTDRAALGLLSVLASRNHLRQGDAEAVGLGRPAVLSEHVRAGQSAPASSGFADSLLAQVLKRRERFTSAGSLLDASQAGVTVDKVSPTPSDRYREVRRLPFAIDSVVRAKDKGASRAVACC